MKSYEPNIMTLIDTSKIDYLISSIKGSIDATKKIAFFIGNIPKILYDPYFLRLRKYSSSSEAERYKWNDREKIRCESIIMPFSSEVYPLEYLIIGELCRKGIVNPIVTTNWDYFLDRTLTALKVNYTQNPCANNDEEAKGCEYFMETKEIGEGKIRVWKVHGDIRYFYFSCGRIRKIPMFEIDFPSRPMIHLENSLSCFYKHHIKDREEEITLFRTIINSALQDLRSESVEPILIFAFKGGDDEKHLVDPILDIAREKSVFNINIANWTHEETPYLWRELEKIDSRYVIKSDAMDVLLEIAKELKIRIITPEELERFWR